MSESAVKQSQGIFSSQLANWFMLCLLPLFAVSMGTLVYNKPELKELILTLNLLLLGYHHVISTYSRIAIDSKSIKENWFFVFALPLIVIFSVYLLFQLGGMLWIGTIYLYWQWYHYTRQSEGVSKAFGMKSDNKAILNQPLNRFYFYLVPVLSFLLMSSRGDQMFFGTPFFQLTVLSPLRSIMLAALVTTLLMACVRLYKLNKAKQITSYYLIYLLSHFLIYVVSYVLIKDITSGWLVINIWHNAQYIAIVWLFNRNRFKSGVNKDHYLISYLSQPNRIIMYFLFFVLITFVFYGLVDNAANYFGSMNGLPMLLIIYSTINFHHYIVDSQIWKLRKKSVSRNFN